MFNSLSCRKNSRVEVLSPTPPLPHSPIPPLHPFCSGSAALWVLSPLLDVCGVQEISGKRAVLQPLDPLNDRSRVKLRTRRVGMSMVAGKEFLHLRFAHLVIF